MIIVPYIFLYLSLPPLSLSLFLSLSLSLSRSALLNSVLEQGTPFSQWDSNTVVAWLELWVVVPYWYIAAIRNCLQSGEMLAESEWGVVRGVVKGRGVA